MSEEEAFIRSICLEPDDDAPRLVFADWLDEMARDIPCTVHCQAWNDKKCKLCGGSAVRSDGRRERAAFIRLQCTHRNGTQPHIVERRGRILQLANRPVWMDMYKRVTIPVAIRITNTGRSWVEFRRGFPFAISAPWSELQSSMVPLFKQHPIQVVSYKARAMLHGHGTVLGHDGYAAWRWLHRAMAYVPSVAGMTETQAEASLSAMIVAVGRERAGLTGDKS